MNDGPVHRNPNPFTRSSKRNPINQSIPAPTTATATGVSLSMLIHGLSFNRRKAQGRSVFACALVYSYALKLLPWIKVCLSVWAGL